MSHYLEQRLKIRHLRVIDALERHKSLLRASRAINVSQPALTRTLQEIEEIDGVPIFERHARGVSANAVGEVLVETARSVIGQLRRTQDVLEGLAQNSTHTLTVGALPVAADGLLPAVLSSLYRSTPQLRVNLLQGRVDELLPRLGGGEIDMVVGRLYPQPQDDGLCRQVLYADRIALIARAGHPVFADGPLQAECLRRYRLVLPALGLLVERDVTAVIEAMGISSCDSLRTSSTSAMRELLLGSDILTIMPGMLMAGDIIRGELRALPLQDAASARLSGVILRDEADALRPGMPRVLQELERQLGFLCQRGIVAMPSVHTTPQ